MGGGGMMNGGWGMTGGWFVPLLVVILIAVGIMYFMRNNDGNRKQNQSGSLDILKERYAKGEITEEEFERKKAKLDLDN
ncbi:SHOCT domain-containing protein [Bacillus marinisedimentorum]|uniref:SHOCT domain-containing protein n=1 Tax=Bacillus marinisedimentorum TaxID=1821260 RepID=UPI00087320A4|nr:SHOCT domain-containing protein [Bacillus marinisedimentorum]